MAEDRQSRYLDHLPAIFRQDSFLGRFLLPFQDQLDALGDVLAQIDRYCAPALTDSEFLPWLAGWVALVLDEGWDEHKRRRLIGEAVELYRWRGTVHGLKRYLEIYTGLQPLISECFWPGGMQIGVASQIGGLVPDTVPGEIISSAREAGTARDYYVVTEADGTCWYYPADRVSALDIQPHTIVLTMDGIEHAHADAGISRRDGLARDAYRLQTDVGELVYSGDTLLIDRVALPYRFMVDVRVPAADVEVVELDKVRAIIDMEKPAHTAYYLKLTPVVSAEELETMQIAVRSTIAVDTILG